MVDEVVSKVEELVVHSDEEEEENNVQGENKSTKDESAAMDKLTQDEGDEKTGDFSDARATRLNRSLEAVQKQEVLEMEKEKIR